MLIKLAHSIDSIILSPTNDPAELRPIRPTSSGSVEHKTIQPSFSTSRVLSAFRL